MTPAKDHGFLHGQLHDPAASADRDDSATEDREPELLALGDVATGTVDDDAPDAATGSGQRQDPPEAGDVEPAPVGDDEHVTFAGRLDRRGRDVLCGPVLLARTGRDRARPAHNCGPRTAHNGRTPVVAPASPNVSRASDTAQLSSLRSRSSAAVAPRVALCHGH